MLCSYEGQAIITEQCVGKQANEQMNLTVECSGCAKQSLWLKGTESKDQFIQTLLYVQKRKSNLPITTGSFKKWSLAICVLKYYMCQGRRQKQLCGYIL